ncbi:putative igf2 mRNA binding protein [Operophtera brumata]|uniref:Putative igf2 mRNA binding protein n=1 Tax=Operophtera brumata TaxID=104452 RepID=A0A0L7LDB5_OPEBR|nr:putative igf2 mRNA binding protein [Operophtera brumata]
MTVVYFDWLDYLVFGTMLALSALIGVYFAFFAKKKQNTTAEYLMGGKAMGIFPISMSLIASYISGISLLGLPAEMYTYGTQLWTVVLSEWAVSLTIAIVYLPVFYNLQITSTYEYLRLRFDQKVQLLGSIIFIIKMLLYIPIVIYVPALAFSQGGINDVIEINKKGDRLDFFNMDPDPTIRHTFWSTVFGNYFSWLASCSVNQAMVQRCLALSSLKRARMKSDQLLPYFVMTITGSIPALPGIFMSGVFSAALSSMSTGLNSMCGVIFEDLIRPAYNKPITERTASFIMKIIVVVIGALCVVLVFLVEHMGALIQAGKSLAGITAGSLLGLFSMGLFLPWVNATGALVGGIISTVLVGWISLGTQAAMMRGEIVIMSKPVSVAGCQLNYTMPTTDSVLNAVEFDRQVSGTFFLYRLSYLYYTLVGMIVCVIVGTITSYFTRPNDPAMVHRDLLTPIIHRWLPSQHPHCKSTSDSRCDLLAQQNNNNHS